MKVLPTKLPEVLLIEPKAHVDPRGFFMETWHEKRYQDLGVRGPFVQDNVSFSSRGILRGMHFQKPETQGKLVYVLQGEVFDTVVDIRRGSPTFGRWMGVFLSDKNNHQLYVPEGFAHGFCVVSETALMAYKCTRFYNATAERSVLWNDPDIGLEWPVREPILSDKDRRGIRLRDFSENELPLYIST